MRYLILLAALMPVPVMAQDIGYDQGGPYEGIYANHRADGDNGSVRIGQRLGSSNAVTPTAPPEPSKPAGDPSQQVPGWEAHDYQPVPLSVLAGQGTPQP